MDSIPHLAVAPGHEGRKGWWPLFMQAGDVAAKRERGTRKDAQMNATFR